jgi:glycosyltransferase involved in cell wall biosynthesis
MPKISIIVPVYNTEFYLHKCLESIRIQDFQDFEVIVVNDGSTDKSREIINEYAKKDNRFVLIEKSNGGLSTARNAGLLAAKGDFICFVDSDDWIGQKFISNLYECIAENVDIVIGRYTLEDSVIGKSVHPCQKGWEHQIFAGEAKEVNIVYSLLGPANKPNAAVLNYCHMCVWKNLYRKSLLFDHELLFFSEREIMLEDYDFNLRAYYYARKIAISDSSEYYHLIVGDSLSRKFRPSLLEMMTKLYSRTDIFIKHNTFYANQDEMSNRAKNFILKSSVDIAYNCILNTPERIQSSIKSVLENHVINKAYTGNTSIDVAFYYKYFIFLIKHKSLRLLMMCLKMARKMNYFYRLYKSAVHR